MNIILKFLLKNIQEKKLRTFLIVISVALSVALFFASTSISDTIKGIYMEQMKKFYGNSDLIIHSWRNSPSRYFLPTALEKYSQYIDFYVTSINQGVTYEPNRKETVTISLRGIDLDDMQRLNPFHIEEQLDEFNNFSGRTMIISSSTAFKYGLTLGDSIDFFLNNTKYRFRIVAIAAPTNYFSDGGRNIPALVPMDTISRMLSAKGRITHVYIKLNNMNEKPTVMKLLQKEYSRYMVRETFNEQELTQMVNSISRPFLMMTIIILLLSIFIIYTSFKVITVERLPIIGTFRSIGATKGVTDFVLFLESIAYGVLGGLLGLVIGIGILYVMAIILGSNPMAPSSESITLHFTSIQLIISFVLGVVLSFISSFIPIFKVSKIAVKDIVLNNIEQKVSKDRKKTIFGGICLAISIIVPFVAGKKIALVADVVCLVLSIVCVVLLVPSITKFFVVLFEKIYIYLFGNEGIIASKNLRENKNILNNIVLISIGVAAIIMINIVSFSVIDGLVNFYRDADFGVWMWLPRADRSLETRVKTVPGVTDMLGVFAASNVDVKKIGADDLIERGRNQRKRGRRNTTFLAGSGSNSIRNLHGINTAKYLDFWNIKISKEKLKELDITRNILVTNNLREKMELKVGDYIAIDFTMGTKRYQVIGFFDSLMSSGSYALISDKYFKADQNSTYWDDIFVKTSINNDEVVKNIQDKFGRDRNWISTVKAMEENEIKSNKQLFLILRGFSLLAALIGIFGVLNNFLISFMERKRYLAIYRSVGMSKDQIVKMVFIEGLSGGIIGGTIGVFSGLLLVYIVYYLMKVLYTSIHMDISMVMLIMGIFGSVLVCLAASISPAAKSSKLNIIEAIKYE